MGDTRGQFTVAGLSRRHFLSGGALAGVGILLAACGGAATTTPLPPTTTPVPATTPTTGGAPPTAATTATRAASPTGPAPATASAPAPATRATGTPTTGTGTATRTAPAGTATRTAGGSPAAVGDFARLLAMVPQVAPLPDNNGIAFADIARQKRNYGLEGATSLESLQAIGASVAKFSNALGALPLPPEAGVERLSDPQWRATTGYDFWQLDRTISAGTPPARWVRMEGRIDRAEVTAALTKAGHRPTTYRDATYLTLGEDGQLFNLNEPLTRLTLAQLNRVLLDDGALTASAYTAIMRAGIDVRAEALPSFAANADYANLAAAMEPVVGAQLLPGDDFFRQAVATPPRTTPAVATAIATRIVSPDRAKLHQYRLVGLGIRDDGTTHTMLVALHYADAADARADAPILRQRAGDYRLLRSGQLLRDLVTPGEPTIVAAGGAATVILPLAIADERRLNLWQQMFAARDFFFLAE